MYPGVDVRNEFHVDHVFRRSRFKPSKLAAASFSPSELDVLRDRMDRLPNLQLLEGSVNIAKLDQLPVAWAQSAYPTPTSVACTSPVTTSTGCPAA